MALTYGGAAKRLPLGNLNGVGQRYKRWAKTMSAGTARAMALLWGVLFALGIAITITYGLAAWIDLAIEIGLPFAGIAASSSWLTGKLPFYELGSWFFTLSVLFFPVGAFLWVIFVRELWLAHLIFRQRARDAFAAKVFQQLQSGRQAAPFSLYLRPFNFTGQAAVGDLAASALQASAGAGSAYLSRIGFDLEAPLSRAASGVAPLVCLGRPLDHVGAGRILVADENWKQAIHQLMEHAQCIFIIPSTRPGTLWEIDRLVETGVVGKCIFIDLPDRKAAGELFRQEQEWPTVRKLLQASGYELPDNLKKGAIFAVGDGKQSRFRIGYTRSSGAIRGLIRKLVRSRAYAPG